ncbi:ferredoxin [Pseudonocardia sp. DSM 110487]|uniref:ferredoxin n=1 Tax=Pseudonocardia sp. DSM 110487 TaxID=2865833 RepID=UPI001C6A8A3C|nr:ferredoxin [Pseudonocardia sp. DSM 110487]QYN33524.1 ferredoxin [Pseudonocardia sp. DSM 110487]
MSDKLTVHLDTARCSSYGVCVSILPDVFDTPPGSPTVVLVRESVDGDERDDLEEAVRACPAQAISIGLESQT